MERKTRSDAKLGTLPEDRQSVIADYARTHSLAETLAWLRADGLQTSEGALSTWLSSYRLSQRLGRNESTVETLLRQLQTTRPDWTADQLHSAGQAFFSALAIDEQDADVWTATQRLNLDRESAKTRFEFEREKWITESCRKILAAATDQRAKDIAELSVSNEEKIKLLRQTYFADVDELEKSGEVQIPK